MKEQSLPVRYPITATSLVGLAALAQAACATDLCGQRCGLAGECPAGFVCESQGYCVPEDNVTACADREGSSVATDPPMEGPSGLAGAGGNEGSLDGSAGAGQGLEKQPLAIAVRAPSASCADDTVEIELGASGGDGASYRWRIDDPTHTFAPLEATGSRWFSSGAPERAGKLELGVELSDGTTRVSEPLVLLVHARPRLLTERFPALCPGERVSLALAAEDGEPGSYEFSAELDPALGLSLDGASLVGRFSPPASAPPSDALASGDQAPSRLVLAVRDAHCASEPREFPLEVLLAGSESCPQILASSAGATLDQLPPPCLGSDYEQPIVVQPETAAGYTWREVATAPGLHFDPTDRVVRGTPEGPGVITLQVSDERGRSIEAEFPIAPREHCWLAYLGGPGGRQQLHLFDPRLPEQRAARHSYPVPGDAGVEGDVLDFAFSPHGRFLAYRVAPGGGPSVLRLLDLLGWSEHELELPGSVNSYAWSGREAAEEALAVSFEGGGEEQLGGLVLSPALGERSAIDGAPFAPYDLVYLQPTRAAVLSGLAWSAAGQIAFLAPDARFAPGRLFQSARIDAGLVSLGPPRERLQFFEGARIQPTPGGVFVTDNTTGLPHFFAANGDEVDHGSGMVLSPSGAFTARAVGGTLSVFRVTDRSVLETDPAWAQAEGCTSLLAWAHGRERIACAVVADGEQRLAFFDLPDPDRPELVPLERVEGDYRLLDGEHVGQPRLFADGGGRFAFVNEDDVFVVQLDDGSPRIEASASLTVVSGVPARPVQLSFSARSHFLSVHAGTSFAVWGLDHDGRPLGRIRSSLPEPGPCGESSFDALPWCGAEASERVARWSADEGALVYRALTGELDVVDVSLPFRGGPREVAVDPGCGDGCVAPGTYTFQP